MSNKKSSLFSFSLNRTLVSLSVLHYIFEINDRTKVLPVMLNTFEEHSPCMS